MTISWWKTGVRLPERGGTIQAQSAGHPPRARPSAARCFMKDSVAAWWSTMVTWATCGDRGAMGTWAICGDGGRRDVGFPWPGSVGLPALGGPEGVPPGSCAAQPRSPPRPPGPSRGMSCSLCPAPCAGPPPAGGQQCRVGQGISQGVPKGSWMGSCSGYQRAPGGGPGGDPSMVLVGVPGGFW